MNTLSKIESVVVTENTICVCGHPARLHRDSKECHSFLCHCEGFHSNTKNGKPCEECNGTGRVVFVEHAHQAYSEERGTYIEDDRKTEEDCTSCEGTGIQND